MKTIKEVLRKALLDQSFYALATQVGSKKLHVKSSVTDEALAAIEEILEEAKPSISGMMVNERYSIGLEDAVQQFEKNLKQALTKAPKGETNGKTN